MRTVKREKAARRGRRRRRSGAAPATLATALLAGSFAGLADSPVPVVAVAAAAAAHGSAAGCGAPAESTTLATTIAGHQRTAIVHVPSGYSGFQKVPLVLNLHGSGSSAVDQELFTGMDATVIE